MTITAMPAVRESVTPPVEQHPAWCDGATSRCGTHLSRPAHVPATAGRHKVCDDGAAFARAEVATAINETGAPGVYVTVFDPAGPTGSQWADAMFTPAEARRLAAALLEKADLAEADA